MFVGTPLALFICLQLTKEERKGALKRWFWMSILATAELYGGELHSPLYEEREVVQGAGVWVCFALGWKYTKYKADTWFTARLHDIRA